MTCPPPSAPKRRVLIVCTGNSCRSQMAEGWWRHLAGEGWEVHSAGLIPSGVHPFAAHVMEEAGVDISRQSSKHVDRYLADDWDLVVTVCDYAREVCPVIPGARRTEHWPIEDPVGFEGPEEERLADFRRARDEIKERIAEFLRRERE
jgi:arsenate reductase (thioredoxin)